MGETNPTYPVREVAVRCFSSAPHGDHERALEGDIIECRPTSDGVGEMEMSRFLWLRVEGLEENVMSDLTVNVEGYEKRRYQIPLARLAEVAGIDIARVRDLADIYQPFMAVDEETGMYVTTDPPISVFGLVFDTVTGEYL